MPLPPFSVHRATSVADASALLAEYGGDAAAYCGGTELLQAMKMGLASVRHLIDLKRIPGLDRIEPLSDGLSIGAAVTHRQIERSPLVQERLPALAEMERSVANARVRNVGSIGGNLCFAEPHSDPVVLLLVAEATVHLSSGEGDRHLPISSFVTGPFATERHHDELLVSIEIPGLGKGTRLAYRKIRFFERPAVSVAVRVTRAGDRLSDVRVAVGSLGDIPTLLPDVASTLEAEPVAALASAIEGAGEVLAATVDAFDDLNGSAVYKRNLARMLFAQAAAEAAGDGHRA